MRRRRGVPPQAEHQNDVFTAEQAVAAGWTPWEVRRCRERKIWLRVAGRGLIARDLVGGDPLGPAPEFGASALARAAVLTWPDAVVCGATAAALHGFPVPPPVEAEVFTAPGRRVGVRLRPRRSPPDLRPLVLPDGLPVTDRRRTALDCLAALDVEDALDLYAWLSTRRIVAPDDLVAEAERRAGRRGAMRLRRLVELTAGGAVSGAEHRLHALLTGARITGWQAGATVVDANGQLAVVDVAFLAEKVVIEVDGERAHRGRAAFVRDRRRQNALLAAGYLVLRFTWWDLVERPGAVVAEIRRALQGRRAAMGGAPR